jgi:hypothetical protein
MKKVAKNPGGASSGGHFDTVYAKIGQSYLKSLLKFQALINFPQDKRPHFRR